MYLSVTNLKKKDVICKNVEHLNQKLGEGGFSKCVSVVDITDVKFESQQELRSKVDGLKHYAIKIIKREHVDNNQTTNTIKQRLHYQISIHRRLKHPNIVEMYDAFTDQQNYYLRLQLCQKRNMYDIVAQRTFLEAHQVIYFYHQILNAIAYMHQQNIVHRDLKTANIFLKKDQKTGYLTVKVGDFGLSRYVQPRTQILSKCGTPSYVSPQLLLGQKQTLKVDIWSLGVMVNHMRFGQTPFTSIGTNVNVTYENIKGVKLKDPIQLFQEIIGKRLKQFKQILELSEIDISRQDELIKDLIYNKTLKKDVNLRPTAAQLKKQQMHTFYNRSFKRVKMDQTIYSIPAFILDLQKQYNLPPIVKKMSKLDRQMQCCNILKPESQLFILKCSFYQKKRSCFILNNGWMYAKFGNLHILQCQLMSQQLSQHDVSSLEKQSVCICFKQYQNKENFLKIQIVAILSLQSMPINLWGYQQQIDYFCINMKKWSYYRKQANQNYKKQRKQANRADEPLKKIKPSLKVGNFLEKKDIPFVLRNKYKQTQFQLFFMSNGVTQFFFHQQSLFLISQRHENAWILGAQNAEIKDMPFQQLLKYQGSLSKKINIFRKFIQTYLQKKRKQKCLKKTLKIKISPDLETYAWKANKFYVDAQNKNICISKGENSDWICSSQDLPSKDNFVFAFRAIKIKQKNQIKIGVMEAERKDKSCHENHNFVVNLSVSEQIIRAPKRKMNGNKQTKAYADQHFEQLPCQFYVNINRQQNKIAWHFNGKQQAKHQMPQYWNTQSKRLCAIVCLQAEGDTIEFL